MQASSFDTGTELKQALSKSSVLQGVEKARASAITERQLYEKDLAREAASVHEELEEAVGSASGQDDAEGEELHEEDEDMPENSKPVEDGFDDIIFKAALDQAAPAPASKKHRSAEPAASSKALPDSHAAPAVMNARAGLAKEARAGTTRHGKPAGAPSAQQQAVLDKAKEMRAKILDVFSAEKMWEGKVRQRQVEAISKSASTMSGKLGSLPQDKCPMALTESSELMDEISAMESRYDAISCLRAEPRASIDGMEKCNLDALLTCDLATLSTMLMKVAADLIKLMETQDPGAVFCPCQRYGRRPIV